MQMSPEVLAALQTLKDNAENDFERHRIDVLERDLTAPPVAEIIDEKHQRFNGRTYSKRKDGHYSISSARSIHRDIWIYYHGDIPNDGVKYDVHHRNLNPADNDVSNLQLLTDAEHRKVHNQHFVVCTCKNCGRFFKTPSINRNQSLFCSILFKKLCCKIPL